MQILDRTQGCEVEDRADVDEERIVALSCKHLDAAGQPMDRFCFELCVVRGRTRADVARRAGKSLPKHPALPVALTAALSMALAIAVTLAPAFIPYSRDGVGLPFVPVRI